MTQSKNQTTTNTISIIVSTSVEIPSEAENPKKRDDSNLNDGGVDDRDPKRTLTKGARSAVPTARRCSFLQPPSQSPSSSSLQGAVPPGQHRSGTLECSDRSRSNSRDRHQAENIGINVEDY